AREVEVPARVDIAAVTGPVPSVFQFRRICGFVVVVALELLGPCGVHDLADCFFGITHPVVLVEHRGRTNREGFRVDNTHTVPRRDTETARWCWFRLA